MTGTIGQAVEADLDAFDTAAELIVELHLHVHSLVTGMTAAQLAPRAGEALAVWQRLDEYGVDLGMDELKTLLAATAASTQTSSGAETAQSTPGDRHRPGLPANTNPAPLEHHEARDAA